MKKIVTLILCAVLVLALAVPTFALEEEFEVEIPTEELENILTVVFEVKHILYSCDPVILLLCIYTKERKVCLCKTLYTDVPSSFIV